MRRFLSTWVFPLGAAALVAVAGTTARSANRLAEGREELERIQSKLSDKKREKEKADKRSRELRAEVDRISRELTGARRALAQTNARLAESEEKRSAAEARLWASRQSLTQWQERLASALGAYSRRSRTGSEGDFVSVFYERALVADQASSLGYALERHQDVVVLRDNLLAIEDRLRDLKLDRERDERRIEAAAERMRELQKTTEGRRAVLESDIRALNASAQKFERLILDLIAKQKAEDARRAARAKRAAPVPVAQEEISRRWRGRLPRPVEGTVVEKFGRTRNAEVNADVFSNGVKWRTAPDANVAAVAEGEVLYAGPFMNYGLMVLVGHPDGLHSIYAHLSQTPMVRGQKIAAGAAVGRSGRDEQGRPLVYFELRVRGTPVNPLEWVR